MSLAQKMVTACIIDDDKIFVYGFKKLLQLKMLATEVQDFSNGKEAIDFLTNPVNSNNLPDVIFLDINMPIMNGWEFATAFEEIQSQLGKNIALYNISSSVDINDITRAKNNPLIKDYIIKPINEASLALIFNSVISGNNPVS